MLTDNPYVFWPAQIAAVKFWVSIGPILLPGNDEADSFGNSTASAGEKFFNFSPTATALSIINKGNKDGNYGKGGQYLTVGKFKLFRF